MITANIACAVTTAGKVYACGPNDFHPDDYQDQFGAARSWAAEAGEIVVSVYQVQIELPDPKPREGRAVSVIEKLPEKD